MPFDLLLALLLNQTLPAVVSGVAVAMLWMCVFKGELGIVICRWLMAGSVTGLLPGLIISFFFQKMFLNKTRKATASRLIVRQSCTRKGESIPESVTSGWSNDYLWMKIWK